MELVKSIFPGTWLPGRRSDIEAQLKEFAKQVKRPKTLKKPPVAGVVPHAGWMYSGAVAFEVWDNLKVRNPDVVVIFGGHLREHQRSAIFLGDGFTTPMGDILIHKGIAQRLSDMFRFRILDASTWEPDNTIEVQLPMVQYLFPEAKLVVIQVPPRDVILDVVDHLIEIVREFEVNPIYVGSTDLTHYGPRYGFTPMGVGMKAHKWAKEENDAKFIKALTALDPRGCLEEGLSNHSACCPGAAAAAVTVARRYGSEYGELLTHITSYEVHPTGEPIDFVGYCSVVF